MRRGGNEVPAMRYLKYVGLLGVLLFTVAAARTNAQVAVGVRVGPVGVAVGAPPVCPYGYYGYYPYACAPYGYYGSSWFVNGVFIGAGPWYHRYWGPGYWGRPGWGYGYRPGLGYRPGYGYRGAPARGFVAPGHGVGAYHGGGFHGGGFHGGAVRGR
jgi:hypothetical protein